MREELVAKIVGGKVIRKNIKTIYGSTDVDVVTDTAIIMVGGIGKGMKKGKLDHSELGREIMKYQEIAKMAEYSGKKVMLYLADNANPKTVKYAMKKLGEDNVEVFKDVVAP